MFERVPAKPPRLVIEAGGVIVTLLRQPQKQTSSESAATAVTEGAPNDAAVAGPASGCVESCPLRTIESQYPVEDDATAHDAPSPDTVRWNRMNDAPLTPVRADRIVNPVGVVYEPLELLVQKMSTRSPSTVPAGLVNAPSALRVELPTNVGVATVSFPC